MNKKVSDKSLSCFPKGKRGMLTAEETIKLVVSALVLAVLVGLGWMMYSLFTQNLAVEQAKDSLKRIELGIEKLDKENFEYVDVFIESPGKWAILAWPYETWVSETGKRVPSQCVENCVCLCPAEDPFGEGYFENCEIEGICLETKIPAQTICIDCEFPRFDQAGDLRNSGEDFPLYVSTPFNLQIKKEEGKLILQK